MDDVDGMSTLAKPRLREALERVRPEFALLKKNKLIPLNINVMAAAATARGALPKIKALREDFERDCKRFDFDLLDKFETYALAAMQAHWVYRCVSLRESLPTLAAEAIELRDLLLSDATALAKRGLLDQGALRRLQGGNGFLHIASDIMGLANLLRTNWETIVTKTGVTEAELDRAEVLSDRIVQGVGLREQAPAMNASAALERQQAFTLFVRAYDQLRRAVSYVRWDAGDAERIAPSLYAGRRKPKKKVETTEEPAAVEALEASSVVASPAALAAPEVNTAFAVGLPGADPFV